MSHLYIKNMVCNRCIAAVKQELENLNLPPVAISLTTTDIPGPFYRPGRRLEKISIPQTLLAAYLIYQVLF